MSQEPYAGAHPSFLGTKTCHARLMPFFSSVAHPGSRTRDEAWSVRLRSTSRDPSLISKIHCFLSGTLTKSNNYLLLCAPESRITSHKDLPGICL